MFKTLLSNDGFIMFNIDKSKPYTILGTYTKPNYHKFGQLALELVGHEKPIIGFDLDYADNYLYSIDTSYLMVWNLKKRLLINKIKLGLNDWPKQVMTRNNYVVVFGFNRLLVFDFNLDKEKVWFPIKTINLFSYADGLNPKGILKLGDNTSRILIYHDCSNVFKIFDCVTGHLTEFDLSRHIRRYQYLAVSCGGQYLFLYDSGLSRCAIYMFKISYGNKIKINLLDKKAFAVKINTHPSVSIATSKDDKTLYLSQARSSNIRIFNIENEKLEQKSEILYQNMGYTNLIPSQYYIYVFDNLVFIDVIETEYYKEACRKALVSSLKPVHGFHDIADEIVKFMD